jgi:hypothetical protein
MWGVARETAARQNGADYVDVIPWFCTADVCSAVIGGLTTHRDDHHAAENYLVWLSGVLGQATCKLPEGSQLTLV